VSARQRGERRGIGKREKKRKLTPLDSGWQGNNQGRKKKKKGGRKREKDPSRPLLSCRPQHLLQRCHREEERGKKRKGKKRGPDQHVYSFMLRLAYGNRRGRSKERERVREERKKEGKRKGARLTRPTP